MVVVSSCRGEVSLKCHNERKPFPQLPSGNAGDSVDTAIVRCEEGGDDVKFSTALRPGLHTCYNGGYSRPQSREGTPILKTHSQFGSESATRLREADSLVIAHQPWRGEYVPGPCTHRPSSHGSRGCLKSVTARGGLG